jgi:hypothetical protein
VETVFLPEVVLIFPMDICQLPVFSSRNWPEIMEENPENFRSKYCFHKITGMTQNRSFPGRVIRPGDMILSFFKLFFNDKQISN